MILAAIKSMMTFFVLLLLLMLAPAYLSAMGQFLSLLAKMIGVMYTGAPLLFFPIIVIISFIWSIKVFISSK